MLTTIFKHCRNGLIYICIVPAVLIMVLVYGLIGIVEFFIVGIRALIYFFSGRNLFGDLPEDVKVKEILAAQNNVNEEAPLDNVIIEDKPYITNPFEDNKESDTDDSLTRKGDEQ